VSSLRVLARSGSIHGAEGPLITEKSLDENATGSDRRSASLNFNWQQLGQVLGCPFVAPTNKESTTKANGVQFACSGTVGIDSRGRGSINYGKITR
jgi:hypothetical protein